MEIFLEPATWWSLLTLTALEIVLGIDNIVFIAIIVNRLPPSQQPKARVIGLALALILRVILLFTLSWLIHLTQPLLQVADFSLSYRDVIMWAGGLFLIGKSTVEIHNRLEGEEEKVLQKKSVPSFAKIIVQIAILDLVFSLDSIITAIGLVEHLSIMVIAVVIAMIVMIVFAGVIASFIHRHPTIKMLALAFLLLVGVLLFLEGFHIHIPRGYIYFAMGFALFVEILNLRMRKVQTPVVLRQPYGRLEEDKAES